MRPYLLCLFTLVFCATTFAKDKLIFIPGAHFDGDSFQDLARLFPESHLMDFTFPKKETPVTLDDYTRRVCDVAQSSPEAVILVGHSQGGAVMNHALGVCPQKIRALVYVAAVIPLPFETPFQLLQPRDNEHYARAARETPDGVYRIVDRKAFIAGFSQESTRTQRRRISDLMRDEPAGPGSTPVLYDLRVLAAIPKLVVTTKKDLIISPQTQKLYYDRIRGAKVASVDSGHLPMISKVTALSDLIHAFLRDLKAR